MLDFIIWFFALGFAGFILLYVMPFAATIVMFLIMAPFMLIGWIYSKLTGN